jgi:nicotinate-nucleotide adenylyltransferase
VALHRPAPNFTIDTLHRLKALRPGAALGLLLGTDQLASLHRWKEPRQILSLARPITLLREPFASPAELESELARIGFWSTAEISQLAATCVSVPRMDISATAIRRKIASGLPASSLVELDPEVASEIEAHGWYRPRH